MNDKGTWVLAHMYNNDESSGLNLVALQPLTDERLLEIREAKGQVLSFYSSQNVVRSVYANRDDVLDSIVTMATHHSDNSGAAQDVMEHASFDISRKFANMCSLFRSFLDHYDRYFVHAHGKDSLHYKDWKQTLSEEYDSQDSYKLVYMMRNFIQHYDMPPLSISIHDSMAEEHFSTSVKLIESELKKDQKFLVSSRRHSMQIYMISHF